MTDSSGDEATRTGNFSVADRRASIPGISAPPPVSTAPLSTTSAPQRSSNERTSSAAAKSVASATLQIAAETICERNAYFLTAASRETPAEAKTTLGEAGGRREDRHGGGGALPHRHSSAIRFPFPPL